MAIHHSQRSQAERMGFTLEERGKLVAAFHASTAVMVFGVSGKDAINQMTAFLNIQGKDDDIRFQFDHNDTRVGWLRYSTNNSRTKDTGTPTELFRLWGNKELTWVDGDKFGQLADEAPAQVVDSIEDTFSEDQHPKDPPTDARPVIVRNEAGIPFDGAIAYKEGIMAGDNPWHDGTEEYEAWYADWDAAADEAQAEEDENPKGGSVVASKYRAKYAEQGHPTHCGDWLAELLNNYCIGDKNTDLEIFEHICDLNGIDTSKYKREGVGWQGRIRMTGRNLLAKRVFQTGKITVPVVDGPGEQVIDAPADWLSAQRYSKPKAA